MTEERLKMRLADRVAICLGYTAIFCFSFAFLVVMMIGLMSIISIVLEDKPDCKTEKIDVRQRD
jgi:hypothetical protein